MNLPVVVFTCDPYLWLLRPFAYLFNIYWSSLQQVIVCGYSKPEFDLPPNFEFMQITPLALPADEWSTGAKAALKRINHELVVIMLEDYWLTRTVDVGGVRTLSELMYPDPRILRIDLTSDRFFNGQKERIGSYGHYDLVETPSVSPYQMSLQAGIWNRKRVLETWENGWSAHQVELIGSPRLHERTDLRVLGTQQVPIRYANLMKSGRGWVEEEYQLIPAEHRKVINKWIPEGIR